MYINRELEIVSIFSTRALLLTDLKNWERNWENMGRTEKSTMKATSRSEFVGILSWFLSTSSVAEIISLPNMAESSCDRMHSVFLLASCDYYLPWIPVSLSSFMNTDLGWGKWSVMCFRCSGYICDLLAEQHMHSEYFWYGKVELWFSFSQFVNNGYHWSSNAVEWLCGHLLIAVNDPVSYLFFNFFRLGYNLSFSNIF